MEKNKITNYDNKKPVTLLNCRYKCYQVGSMEAPAKNDGGKGWRQVLTPELIKRGIFSFDPTREEVSKVGMTTKKFIKVVKQYQKDEATENFLDAMDKIWKGVNKIVDGQNVHVFGDISYVENSNFLIWNLDAGDKCGGTIIEMTIAWYRNIPVYLISKLPPEEINTSIYYFILSSGNRQGKHFENQQELLSFLDEKYKLTPLDTK
jgi:hypothetical protein